MRVLSNALLAAQSGTKATPHIHISINSVDYSSRLLTLEHIEEQYRDRAVLILRNNDRAFDNVNLLGRKFRIAYGHYTGNNVAEPDGDNAGNEYSYAPDLWIKSQQITSLQGELTCQLYAEGHWAYMREQRILGYGTSPYYTNTFTATTVYDLIEAIIETAMGWTLNSLGTSDGIVDSFTPTFDLNNAPYESAAEVLYRLLQMTKQYMRVKANSIFELVYPQDSDAVNKSYYTSTNHKFFEYAEKISLVVPNSIAVYANQDADGTWGSLITGTASHPDSIDRYVEVLDPYIAGSIGTQEDADERASAILHRIKMEQLAGRLIVPHDAAIELYDKVRIYDTRGF